MKNFEYMYDHTPAGKLRVLTAYEIHGHFLKEMKHLKSCAVNTTFIAWLGIFMIYFGAYDLWVGIMGLAMFLAAVTVLINIFYDMKNLRRK